MKNKIIKSLTLGLSCLMLTLTISTATLSNNTKSTNTHIIKIDIESPNS
ncbi:hypothetical protein SAMN02745134_03947 [Clostridium acidisoli DSM 12555]|uniref:Uncharacterized protein n=1 Tax=Clostridium acidisoli DSM 12555 TaxID=1121291 RepID=A0A1W1Y0D0_9CLOT|nr:hypothetical protein [Clostridium acidisoli]SMC29587.1 hypothetical protein SAMN02745134_03947 [Clostridium acidisoli DSM 12555]